MSDVLALTLLFTGVSWIALGAAAIGYRLGWWSD